MSFRPPQLSQFVRVPPEVRRLQGVTRNLAPAGVLALISGVLGTIAFVLDFDNTDGYGQAALSITIAGALIGGLLALMRQPAGAAIAAGGVALFVGSATTLIGASVNFDDVLDANEAKLVVAAGIIGLVAAAVALNGLGGRGNGPLGTVIAIASFVPPISIGAVIHIDDYRAASAYGVVIGSVLVAVIMAVGAVRGTFGALAAVVAAGAQVPSWWQIVKDNEDRRAASVAALVASCAIVLLGIIAVLLSVQRDAAGAATDPTSATLPDPGASWPPTMATNVPASPGFPMPGAQAGAAPRTAPVVPANAPPAVPAAAAPTPGRWAPDPYGRFQVRYWNGTAWTAHVANDGVTALDPMA